MERYNIDVLYVPIWWIIAPISIYVLWQFCERDKRQWTLVILLGSTRNLYLVVTRWTKEERNTPILIFGEVWMNVKWFLYEYKNFNNATETVSRGSKYVYTPMKNEVDQGYIATDETKMTKDSGFSTVPVRTSASVFAWGHFSRAKNQIHIYILLGTRGSYANMGQNRRLLTHTRINM